MDESVDDIGISNQETERTPLLSGGPRLLSTSIRTPWDPRRGKIAAIIILLVLTFERLAFYAVHSNLYVFLTAGPVPWPSDQAIVATLLMLGLAYFSALPAGWIADSLIGRFWTITGGLILYVISYIVLTLLASNKLKPICDRNASVSNCSSVIYFVIIIVGLGVGTVKANIPPFGAAQVRSGGITSIRQFFNWYYWCINVGSFIGIGVLSYFAQDQVGSLGFPFAFTLATVSLVIALILMILGRPLFVIHTPAGYSLIGNILHMVKEGIIGKINTRRTPVTIENSPILSHENAANAGVETDDNNFTMVKPISWLDYAKIRFGGSHRDSAVDEVKKLGPVILLLLSLMPYWIVYLQSDSGFQAQAVHLKVDVGNLQIPTAWLGMLDQVFILLFIPLLNYFVYPFLDRIGYSLNLTSRIGIGMGFAMFAVALAGGLETISLHAWNTGHQFHQKISNKTYNNTDISVLWQVPQYGLVGIAEVFASVAGLELAHSTSPKALQGVVMGLFSATEGVASFLGLALVALLSPAWITPDADHFQGHFNWYFFLLATLQFVVLITCILFLYIIRPRVR